MNTEGNQSVTPSDSQGDLRASHTAADAFNNFASTIEEIAATALAQTGLEMVVNPVAEDGINPASANSFVPANPAVGQSHAESPY